MILPYKSCFRGRGSGFEKSMGCISLEEFSQAAFKKKNKILYFHRVYKTWGFFLEAKDCYLLNDKNGAW